MLALLLSAFIRLGFQAAFDGGRGHPPASGTNGSASSKALGPTKSSTSPAKPAPLDASLRNLNTSVIPTGPISFATSTVGWLAEPMSPGPMASFADFADGQESGEQLGRWSVSVTDDGGRRWTTTLDLSPYVWGIDSIGTHDVWVTGLNALYSSSDGGLVWQRVGEPKGSALVRVAFESATDGVGLTVNGDVATTTDGGEIWADSGQSWIPNLGPNYIHGAANLCISGSAVVMDDSRGDIFRSTEPADPNSWTAAFRSLVPRSYQALSVLDCSSTAAVWEETYTEGQGPQAGIYLGWVVRSSNHGANWTSNGDPYGSTLRLPAVSRAKWGNAFGDGMMMSSGASQPVDAMIPLETDTIAELVQSTDGVDFVADDFDGLFGGKIPTSRGASGRPDSSTTFKFGSFFLSIFGISYDSPTDGWLDAVAEVGRGPNMKYTNIVLHSSDAGSSWNPVYVSNN